MPAFQGPAILYIVEELFNGVGGAFLENIILPTVKTVGKNSPANRSQGGSRRVEGRRARVTSLSSHHATIRKS